MMEAPTRIIWQEKGSKGRQIRKSQIVAGDMILYKRESKNSTRKHLEIINNFSQVYKFNLQKSIVFLHTSTKHTEKEIIHTLLFTIAS